MPLSSLTGIFTVVVVVVTYIYRFAELDYLVEDIYCYSEFHAPCGAIIRQLPKITDTYGDVQNFYFLLLPELKHVPNGR